MFWDKQDEVRVAVAIAVARGGDSKAEVRLSLTSLFLFSAWNILQNNTNLAGKTVS